jgi:hypothetical protein
MKHDLISYRNELQRKLDAVNSVIADIGSSIPSPAHVRSTNGRRKGKRQMSAAGRARIAAAARARWKKAKAAGRSSL